MVSTPYVGDPILAAWAADVVTAITAAQANITTLQSAVTALQNPATPTKLKVVQAAAVSRTASVVIPFDTLIEDTASGWSTGSSTYTVPTGQGGTYLWYVMCQQAAAGSAAFTVRLAVSSNYASTTQNGVIPVSPATASSGEGGAGIIHLTAGDTVKLMNGAVAWSTPTASATSEYNTFGLLRLGA